jgi:hypothetical protein
MIKYLTRLPCMQKTQSAQEIQDNVFRKMSADEKLKLASGLWLLARELDKEKTRYGNNRAQIPSRRRRQDS